MYLDEVCTLVEASHLLKINLSTAKSIIRSHQLKLKRLKHPSIPFKKQISKKRMKALENGEHESKQEKRESEEIVLNQNGGSSSGEGRQKEIESQEKESQNEILPDQRGANEQVQLQNGQVQLQSEEQQSPHLNSQQFCYYVVPEQFFTPQVNEIYTRLAYNWICAPQQYLSWTPNNMM